MQRGIVTTPVILGEPTKGYNLNIERFLTDEELNYYILYWDKIVMPKFAIHLGLKNEQELIQCGVLSRMPFHSSNISSADLPRLNVSAQYTAVDELRKSEPGTDWRIHQIGSRLNSPYDFSVNSPFKERISIELMGLLPVPQSGVNLHDILEFKERRCPELTALHSYCDDLYLEVLNSADPNLQRARNFTKLKKAIDDLDRINSQGWQSPIKFNLDISSEFDISNIRAGYAMLLGATQSPVPITTAILGGALSVAEGFVKIKVELRSVRKSNGINHMVYLSNAKQEGIL